jgi:hypothetical protein
MISAIASPQESPRDRDIPFNGYWKSEHGSIVKIDGNEGVLINTSSGSWKKFVKQTTIKIIRSDDDQWLVEEWMITADDAFWVEAVWTLTDNRIERLLNVKGKKIETFFVRVVEEALPKSLVVKEETLTRSAMPDEAAVRHSFEFASTVFRFEYEEPSLMSEKGFMYGILGRYAFNNNAVMLGCSLEFAAGDLDYDGRTFGGTPVTADTEDYLLEFRSLIGGNIRQGKTRVTPFIGIGVRYWNDTIQASGGYEREITYLYTPIGVNFTGPLSAKWSWGFSGEYDLFWKGWIISHLSDVDPGFNDPENDQSFGDGFGVRISFKFRNQISEKFSWYIEPFFRYWDVGQSDTAILTYYGTPAALVVEPDNNTTSYGLTVGIGF